MPMRFTIESDFDIRNSEPCLDYKTIYYPVFKKLIVVSFKTFNDALRFINLHHKQNKVELNRH